MKQKCTVQENRTITISELRANKKARKYNKTDDFKEDMKQRAHIEPKQGIRKYIMVCREQNIGDFRK